MDKLEINQGQSQTMSKLTDSVLNNSTPSHQNSINREDGPKDLSQSDAKSMINSAKKGAYSQLDFTKVQPSQTQTNSPGRTPALTSSKSEKIMSARPMMEGQQRIINLKPPQLAPPVNTS